MSARKTIPGWQKEIHKWAKSKGWWGWQDSPVTTDDDVDRAVVSEKLLLVHTEVSEAAEELRNAGMRFITVRHEKTPHGVKPVGFPTELADIVIRVFDLAEACGIDMVREIARKMDYNKRRAYRHGGKLL